MILIRRILAGVGLMLLLPVAVGLVTGSIDLADAGIRATTLFAAILVLRKALPAAVIYFADTLDGTWRGEPVGANDEDDETTTTP